MTRRHSWLAIYLLFSRQSRPMVTGQFVAEQWWKGTFTFISSVHINMCKLGALTKQTRHIYCFRATVL